MDSNGSSKSERNSEKCRKVMKKVVSFAEGTIEPRNDNIALSISKHTYVKELGYTQYYVQLLYKENAWSIHKRYRDFEELANNLAAENVELELPKLPKKRWFEKQRWLNKHEESYSSTRRCALQEYLRNLVRIPQLRRKSNVLKYFLNFNFIEECVDADYDDYYEEDRRKQFNEFKETFASNNARPSEDRESNTSWGDRSPREGGDDFDPAPSSSEDLNSPRITSDDSNGGDGRDDFTVRVSTEGEVFLKGNHSTNLEDDAAEEEGCDCEVDTEGDPVNRLERSGSMNSEDSQFEYDDRTGGIRTANEYNSHDSDDEEGYVDEEEEQQQQTVPLDPQEVSDAMEVEDEEGSSTSSTQEVIAKSPSRMLPEELHNYSLTI